MSINRLDIIPTYSVTSSEICTSKNKADSEDNHWHAATSSEYINRKKACHCCTQAGKKILSEERKKSKGRSAQNVCDKIEGEYGVKLSCHTLNQYVKDGNIGY